MKIIFKISIPLLITLYFPLFGKIIPLFNSVPFNFVHWSTLFLGMLVIGTYFKNGRFYKLDPYLVKVLQFNLCYAGLLLVKGIATGDFHEAINLAAGVNISTLLILFLTQQKEFGRSERLFEVLTKTMGLMLVLQTLISAIESASGFVFGDYLINVYGTLEERDILSVFQSSQMNIFGFTIPFTGLIGAHNAFGIMLLFFTTFFLSAYEARKSLSCLFFLTVVLFAIVGNGTRSALLLMIMTVIIFFSFPFAIKASMYMKVLLFVVTPVGIILSFGPVLLQKVFDFYYQSQSDTMGYRILLWQGLLERHVNFDSIPRALFGMVVRNIKMATVDVVGDIVSVEMEYIRIYLTAGVVGLILYIRAFGAFLRKKFRMMFPQTKISLTMLSVNVFLISIVMTGVIFYAVYFVITLTILQAVHYKRLRESQTTQRENLLRHERVIIAAPG